MMPLSYSIASSGNLSLHHLAPWLLLPASLLLLFILIDTMIERGDTARFKAAWQAFRSPPPGSLRLD